MLILLLLALTGCAVSEESSTEVDCDLMAAWSVSASLVDADGAAFATDGAYLYYSVDGAEELAGEVVGDAWVAGMEQTGEFTIRAGVDFYAGDDDCTGYWIGETTEVVTIAMGVDGCHVDSAIIDIVIEPDCIVDSIM